MQGALYLEDGSIFLGKLFGYPAKTEGEVVFSTGMTGYPQSLTDPSYAGQILIFTYPLIGNYGIHLPKFENRIIQNFESENIQIKGLIVSSIINDVSHWQAGKTLNQWMSENKIPGLAEVDTRKLTQKLREKGTMRGKITNKFSTFHSKGIIHFQFSINNLVSQVSCKKPIIYKNGQKKVLLIDCGVKAGIIRDFYKLGLTVIRVPWNYDKFPKDISGAVISNGPGNPEILKPTVEYIKHLLNKKIPVLGICLGSQLLCLAAGGKTYKMKYGHRSVNQPVLLAGSRKAYITSQNHGYAVKMGSLNTDWQEWFVNLNDGTNEGIKHRRLPFMGVQFHPEGCPGAKDTAWVFKEFIKIIK